MNTIIINGRVTKRLPELKTSKRMSKPYWVFYVEDQRSGIKNLYWRCVDFRTTNFYKTLETHAIISVTGRVDRLYPYQLDGKLLINNDIYVYNVDYATSVIPCAPDYDPTEIDTIIAQYDKQMPCVEF